MSTPPSAEELRARPAGRKIRELAPPLAAALLVWVLGGIGKFWLLINAPWVELDSIPMWSVVGDFIVYFLAALAAGLLHPAPERLRTGRSAVVACAVPVAVAAADALARFAAGDTGAGYILLVLVLSVAGALAGWGASRLR